MEAYKRRQNILALLEETGEVTIIDLASRFEVSPNTIRNDLDALEAGNLLRRVRGGATVLGSNGLYSPEIFASQANTNRLAKERIGRWAAGLVKDGDGLVLDASSSVYTLATFLKDRQNLTVITNGLRTGLLLAQSPSNKVIWAANVIRPDGSRMVGSLHPDLLDNFYASKCFITCSGFSLDQGLTVADVDEAPLKTQMIKLARQAIALIDASKFGKVDTYKFAGVQDIDLLVTDETIAPDTLARLRQAAHCPVTVIGASAVETFTPASGEAPTRRYRIGFGNLADEKMMFARQVRRSLERAARRLANVELLIRDNNLDAQAAIANADWFIKHGVDLVIEYQIDVQAGNVMMHKFNQSNIPVIAVDIPMPGATFYGADNYGAGYIAGEALGNWIKEHWAGKLDLLLKLEASKAGPVVGARLQGQQNALEAAIGRLQPDQVISIDGPVSMGEIEPVMTGLVSALSPEARVAIIAINDDTALGALSVFQKAGRLSQVVAVGQGADRLGRDALRRSSLPFLGSTRYAPESYGDSLLDLALKILRGEPVPPAVYNRHDFITRENVDRYYPLPEESAVAKLLASTVGHGLTQINTDF
jgi:ribose transport system substrate-binding protein